MRADGTYVAGPWPELILISDGLLAAADGQILKVDGDTVTFDVRNGSAVYHRAGESTHGATLFKRGGCVYSMGAIDVT